MQQYKKRNLQDLYGTPQLTTTEYNQKYNAIKTKFWTERLALMRLRDKQEMIT